MIGINLGSGQRKFHTTGNMQWINVDCNPKWEPDIVSDGAHLSQIESNSVDYVVLHHVLEHYGCGEARDLIRECHRVLKPFGSLLVFVPNMQQLAIMWQEGVISTQVWMTNIYGAYMDDEADRHKWGYDRYTLGGFLHQASTKDWNHIHLFDWRPIEGADIARDRWILGMEAIK